MCRHFSSEHSIIRLIRNLRDLHLWHSGFKRNIEISYGKVKGYHSFASRLWAEQETDHWKKAAWGKWVIFLFPWVMRTCGRFFARWHEQKCLHSIYWLAIAFSINLNTINFILLFKPWWDIHVWGKIQQIFWMGTRGVEIFLIGESWKWVLIKTRFHTCMGLCRKFHAESLSAFFMTQKE